MGYPARQQIQAAAVGVGATLAVVYALLRRVHTHPLKTFYKRRKIKSLDYVSDDGKHRLSSIYAIDGLRGMSVDKILVKVADALRVVSLRRPNKTTITQFTPELSRKLAYRASQLCDRIGHPETVEVNNGLVAQAPASVKAFLCVKKGTHGPDPDPVNPNLKMMLMSGGLRPASSRKQREAYERMYAGGGASARRKGVVYLIDARLEELEFEIGAADPDECSAWTKVAYKREPDVPGGAPVCGADGRVLLKSQEELFAIGRPAPVWMLRHKRHFSNGFLESLCPSDDPDEEFPVTVAYLWSKLTGGKDVDASTSVHDKSFQRRTSASAPFVPGRTSTLPPSADHQHTIYVGEGTFSRSRGYVARRADDGRPYDDADYERASTDPSKPSHFFRAVSAEQWKELLAGRRTVFTAGGVPWYCVAAMQPDFIIDGVPRKDYPNHYARGILDSVAAGELVYTGNSAGTIVMSFALGPLTADGTARAVRPKAPSYDYGARGELGMKWLYPGIGEYVGVPHRLVFRPHVTFDPEFCRYQGRALAASRSLLHAASAPLHDLWACILNDYDFDNGKSDAFEISGGRCVFHVGKCDTAPFELGDVAREELRELHGDDTCFARGTLPRQPPGVPAEGVSFEWTPRDGEIIGAGPHATANLPRFRLYCDENGPLMDAPPT